MGCGAEASQAAGPVLALGLRWQVVLETLSLSFHVPACAPSPMSARPSPGCAHHSSTRHNSGADKTSTAAIVAVAAPESARALFSGYYPFPPFPQRARRDPVRYGLPAALVRAPPAELDAWLRERLILGTVRELAAHGLVRPEEGWDCEILCLVEFVDGGDAHYLHRCPAAPCHGSSYRIPPSPSCRSAWTQTALCWSHCCLGRQGCGRGT